jgi:hypothetical protein
MSADTTAPRKKLGELHGELARVLLDEIRKEGAPASVLNVARQFLKDNGIESLPVAGSHLNQLREALPFPSTEGFKDDFLYN